MPCFLKVESNNNRYFARGIPFESLKTLTLYNLSSCLSSWILNTSYIMNLNKYTKCTLLGSYTPVSVLHSFSRLTNMKVSKPTNMKVDYTQQHEPSTDLHTCSMFVTQPPWDTFIYLFRWEQARELILQTFVNVFKCIDQYIEWK